MITFERVAIVVLGALLIISIALSVHRTGMLEEAIERRQLEQTTIDE